MLRARGGGKPFFFFDARRSSSNEGRRRETLLVNHLMPSSNKEAQSNDKVFCKIEDYFDEVERGESVQVGDPPQYVLSSHAWLGARSSGGADPLISVAPPADAGA